MILYHGSNILVKIPQIIAPKKSLDFGTGFYTTSSLEQAKKAVANDRVYAILNAFENGFMDKATLLKELKTWVYVDQILFHTEKALQLLEFKEEIKL